MFRQAARTVVQASRSLSTSAIRAAEAKKAPIQIFGIEGRYAHALYSAASKKQALDKVEKELTQVANLVGESQQFADFLKNPVLSRQEKSSIVQDIMKQQKVSDTTVNFFGALAENNRLANTMEVIDAFKQLMSATRGEVACVVTSAADLKSAQKKSIESALKGFVPSDQKVKVEYQVDASIIGGFMVDVGEKHVDLSVKTKVQKYRNILSESL
eukprot:m.10988 g.10988  ORF g.10988 m.10988 type:complete len:214 (-) comp9733_c0_seq1:56-697(-)